MRYLSVCSGIEAASVAWHHLGWSPVAFSEIEPFPAAVLAHHYPNVPNYGDMTKHKEWPLGPGSIDLLVGGTPCQSFSVAGLRKGISDPRGGLMLTYLEIAQRLRPRWIVWENVPGVLSSGGGRDFGSFLGALGELGYGWAYRVLDAQWVRTQRHPRAVPQRRRRVFVVGCLGDWDRAAQVLFERESVQRDSAPRRAPGQGSAADAEAGARAGCCYGGADANCSDTVTSKWSKGSGGPSGNECGLFLAQPIAGTLGNRGLRSHTELDGHGAYIPVQQPVVSIQGAATRINPSSGPDGIGVSQVGVAYTLEARSEVQAVAFSQNQREEVREVEVPGALAAEPGTHQQTYIAQPVPYDLFQITAPVNRQNRRPGDPCHTLARDNAAHAAVAFAQNQVGEIRTSNVSGTINTNSNASGRNTPMAAVAHAFYSTGGTHGVNQHPEVSPAVKVGSGLGIPSPPAVAHALRGEGFDASEDGTGRGTPLVPQAMTVRRLTPTECSRLQGFPDDWTLIPWRGKPAEQCPDGPRYKALGNSMACNCMAWIGERIAAVEARHA